jgi:hypothetical protein
VVPEADTSNLFLYLFNTRPLLTETEGVLQLGMYLPRKEIEIGLKTPGTSVNIVSIKHKEAVGRRWPSNLDEIQHIMKLPMNITYKHRFTWRVYWYFHTIRLP